MDRFRRLAAGLGVVVAVGLAGCLNINVPGDVNVSGGDWYTDAGGGVHSFDAKKLPDVVSKLESVNREIGEELAAGDWEDVNREAAKLAQWADRADGLSRQAREP